jgi:PleD family two-component response regulator
MDCGSAVRSRAGDSTQERNPLNRPRIIVADNYQPMQERVSELLQTSYDVVGAVGNAIDLVEQRRDFILI